LTKEAQQETKEEFISGADLENTRIDYWNVQDQPKKESIALKFLGGPGRGQTQRGTEILSTLKSVMEKYTKKALTKYYDSLDIDSDLNEKIKEVTQKLADIDEKIDSWDGRLDELERVAGNLSDYLDYFDEPEFRNEEDQGLFDWGKTQEDKALKYRDSARNKIDVLREDRGEIQDELTELKDKVNKKGLTFYDVEKNISINN